MLIRLIHHDIRRFDISTRMPFKYGIAHMTEVPHVFVSVTALVNGEEVVGYSADHLPPKWFTKDPDIPLEQEIREMEAILQTSLEAAGEIAAPTPFEFWYDLYQKLMSAPEHPPLLQNFGITLVERAMLDAFCRKAKQPLWKLVLSDSLGIDLSRIAQELAGFAPAEFLPKRPLESVNLRHTVGMADSLRESDIGPAERLDDGLPQSLEACIKVYGLKEFKLKLSGDTESDLKRLGDISDVITKAADNGFQFSLDGNEQYDSPEHLHAFGEQVYSDPRLREFFNHLMFIEQPITRKAALAKNAPDVSHAWPRAVPIIIDESDGSMADFPRALELGYAGVSHKNCKGVFKGIRNRCLVGWYQKKYPNRHYLMTGEDLSNIGPIALLQDLAVQALLGNESVERNGHHYFKGLRMFSPDISKDILYKHPDLYQADQDGSARLSVTNGQLNLTSVNDAPFGIY